MSLKELLRRLDIDFSQYQHPPLATCCDADALGLIRSGLRTKNLFLRNDNGKRHFLLVTSPQSSVDLRRLSKQMGVSRLGFASAARLDKYLGIKPGHVSLLALGNDAAAEVELWLDDSLWCGEALQCHPLDNQQTWAIAALGIEKLLAHWQRPWQVIEVPIND
ncbi:prolyl-tRNA synthetase associated domain-containing protein [Ferrimonas lipolytica]|uniref:Prolyl-tRNA synthetase associated domain-containing protein n=1 Tax=Ferrimonas lipolytica TaxID=2724191 RepID=A0A6H1UIX7_9GAMM|nr:prolyl-tRNA synthetase associated domain-containing protein [Ferrimonas lipolytica]